MLRIHNIKLDYRHSMEQLQNNVAKKLHCSVADFTSFQIVRQSLDTRKKPDIFYIYSVDVSVPFEEKFLKRNNDNNIAEVTEKKYAFHLTGEKVLETPPVIVGCGPAGLFCGLELARNGYTPILIERGKCVEERIKDVDAFWNGANLNTESNVQFGEGGAGTFSDGKLNTLVKDPLGRNHKVLEEFVRFGAEEAIKIQAKPHIGTDVLIGILKKIRQEIISLGGTFLFESKMDTILTDGTQIQGIRLANGQELETKVLILAIGNSARDTFTYLNTLPLLLEAKPFAVGLRVEHPQELINEALYGSTNLKQLPVGAYKVTAKTHSQKGVYSFCMCPGGYVVNASSEKEELAVNGMSFASRNGSNANSAIVMTVDQKDFLEEGALSGMHYQQRLEHAAFMAGNGAIPQQLLKDFKTSEIGVGYGGFSSAVKGQTAFADLSQLFSAKMKDAFLEGMQHFGKIMKGFDQDDTILSGVESRTSSPVKIPRNALYESPVHGIFPCGEGAGYAGGIVSAAMDGLKIAQAVASQYRPK